MGSTSSGRVSGLPTTEPISESLLTYVGSNFVPIATNPPGLTFCTSPAPVPRVEITERIGSYLFFFSSIKPGLISISSPNVNSPCIRAPPITPPLTLSSGKPGLFISKDLKTCIIAALLVDLGGVLIDVSIASIRASMFNLCCAEIGMMGAFEATLPFTNSFIWL